MTEQTTEQTALTDKRRMELANKVKALFAKSASASEAGNEAEAEACWLKAQELLTKYSIDAELARITAKGEGKVTARPTHKKFYLQDGPYLKSRAQLAIMVSRAMGLVNRVATNGEFVVFFGFPEDIEDAWEMFELIEPQMLATAARRIQEGRHHWEGIHAKTYRINYFNGYAVRIQQRLIFARKEAAEEVVFAEGQGAERTGRVTGALVLVGREDEVRAFYKELYPERVKKDGTPRKRQQSAWGGPSASRHSAEAQQQGLRDAGRARIRRDSELASRRAIR
jgi:hypothetical protein